MQRPRVGASSSFCEMCKESRVSEGKVNGDETGKQARAQVTRGPGRPWESVCVTGKPPACLSKEATGMISGEWTHCRRQRWEKRHNFGAIVMERWR